MIGIHPYQQTADSTFRMIVVISSMVIGLIPMFLQLHEQIRKKDLDGIIEELPHIFTMFIALIKYLNIVINRKHFKILFDCIMEDWRIFTNELHVLDKISKQGNRLAYLYRSTLLTFLVIFLFIPLIPVALDIIIPLNETRPRHQVFKVNYIIIDVEDYFYTVYCHLTWISIISVLLVITVDSLYMLIIHHASGLSDVCGYQIEMASTNHNLNPNGSVVENYSFERFRQCVITHHKCLRFYNTIQQCSETMNLLQIGFSMMEMSLTAVQIVLYMDRPAEVLRFILFLIAQEFHLFVMCFSGQVLLNHSTMIRVKLYNSKWHDIPMKLQKIVHMMQIRCSKTCILTARGLYDLNIENFGATVKACMSYFTMFLSLRE